MIHKLNIFNGYEKRFAKNISFFFHIEKDIYKEISPFANYIFGFICLEVISMHRHIFSAFFLIITLIVPLEYLAAGESLVPFPYYYEPIPTLNIMDGVPLRLDLGEYLGGVSSEQISKIGYQFLDQEVTVFQDPQDPLKIAILYPRGKPGLRIFPLRFEFSNGNKSDFFIACHVAQQGDVKTESLPRLLPYQKRVNKKNKTEEYVFYYYDETNKNPLDAKSIKVLFGNEKLVSNISFEENKIIVPLPEGVLKGQILRVFVKSQSGKKHIEAFTWESSDGEKPFVLDWNDNILYYVFTDRFQNGNPANDKPATDPRIKIESNWQGGDFPGLESRIKEGYFQKLGVTGIILSPVVQNAEGVWQEKKELWTTSFRGFWPVNPRETDPHFGALNELKSLIQTAHSHNLKSILDFPVTHVHQDHPYFKNHPDWFAPHGSEAFPDFADTPSSPSLFQSCLRFYDFNNSNAQEQIITDAVWWLETTDADGLWHGHSSPVPPLFRKKLFQAVREKIELPHRKKISYYTDGEYSFMSGVREGFGTKTLDLGEMDKNIRNLPGLEGALSLKAPCFDLGSLSRFATLGLEKPGSAESDKKSYELLLLAMAYIFTQSGAPVILYGDEIGMQGEEYPDKLKPMRFDKDLSEPEKLIWEQTAHLARLRLDHKALRTGESITLLASKDDLVFLKCAFSEKIVCVFHRGDTGANLVIDLPLPFQKVRKVKSLLHPGKSKIEKGRIHLEMPPRSVDFLLLEGIE